MSRACNGNVSHMSMNSRVTVHLLSGINIIHEQTGMQSHQEHSRAEQTGIQSRRVYVLTGMQSRYTTPIADWNAVASKQLLLTSYHFRTALCKFSYVPATWLCCLERFLGNIVFIWPSQSINEHQLSSRCSSWMQNPKHWCKIHAIRRYT